MSAAGFPLVEVHRAAVQSVPAGVNTAIVFDTADVDQDALWDQAHKSRIVVPTLYGLGPTFPGDGLYLAFGTAHFSQVQESTRRFVGFRINGAGEIFGQDSRAGINDANIGTECDTTIPLLVVAGDYIETIVRHDSLSAPRDCTATFAMFGPIATPGH